MRKTRIEILELIAKEAFKAAEATHPESILERIRQLKPELDRVYLPLMMRVRIKNHPSKWVGQTHPSYALHPDQHSHPLQLDAHWYVPESRAKVWTSLTVLKRVVTLSKYGFDSATFSQFEVVFGDGSVKPLDEVVK